MSEEKKPETAAAAAPAGGSDSGGGGGGKITVILTAVNLVVTLGVVGFLVFQFMQEKKRAALEDIDPEAETHVAADGKEGEHGEGGAAAGAHHGSGDTSAYGKMVALDPFTVNLATSGSVQPRFARVNISVEIPSDEVEAEVAAKMPQVRNIVLDLFNSKRPSDLQNPEGRNYLKEELRNAINSALVSGKVKGVFFTSFAMSS